MGCLCNSSPIPLSQNRNFTRQDAQIINRASSTRYAEKATKYNKIYNTIGIKFQPFIIETTGRIPCILFLRLG